MVMYRRARLSVTLSPLTFSPPEEEAGIPLLPLSKSPLWDFLYPALFFFCRMQQHFSVASYLRSIVAALRAENTSQHFARNHSAYNGL